MADLRELPFTVARTAASLWRHRRAVAVACALALAAAGSGYLFWFRDSSLVAVRHVKVLGVESNRGRVSRALSAAAREMTTLHVRMEELKGAARPFATVKAIRVETDFPTTMIIRVTENVPVALVRQRGRSLPVAADGSYLDGLSTRGRKLPVLRLRSTSVGQLGSSRIGSALLRVLAAAPRTLRPRLARAYAGARGIVVDMRSGPRLYFYGAGQAAEKWRAVARVLADPKLAKIAYIDLQIPSRPAVGGGSLPIEPQPAPAAPVPGVQPAPAAPAPQPQPQPVTPAAPGPAPSPQPPAASAGAPATRAPSGAAATP